MTLQIILFALFASVAVISSVMVVTRRNPVIAALFLILNFGALAGLYLLLAAQFIAVVQIIVYAGAIMVLFLFVIMLLRPEAEKRFFEENPRMKWYALGIGGLTLATLVYAIFLGTLHIQGNPAPGAVLEIGKVEAVGSELFSGYLLPFEAIGFVLLAATVGAMVLAKKKLDS
jgi:NADH-quinone oxidoreductase subunit J